MENIPLYVSLVFISTTVAALLLLYKSARNSKRVLLISLLWMGMQAVLGISGFYLITDTIPPRFGAAVIPPVLFIAACFITKKGKAFLDLLNTKWLMLLHVVRVPVEVVLLWLYLHQYVPELMTFEGRNFDILSGLTAPLVFYFGFVRQQIHRNLLLAWNFLCLALLINIVVNAMLSAPSSFQQFAFEQPNVGVLYFPFIWLPCFIVPVVLLSHLVSIRQLLKSKAASVKQILTTSYQLHTN